MRFTTALSLVLCFLLELASSDASEPRILTEARNLNRARHARINAEIALQKTLVRARKSLLQQGYAAPLEVDASHTRLRELQALRTQIRKYDAFLQRVAESCSERSEPTWRDQILAISLPRSLAPHGQHAPWIVQHTDEVKSLSEQLATTKSAAEGELRALAAETGYLEALLTRLRKIDDGSLALQREMDLAGQRLAIQRCRTEMGHAQQRYESCRELLHEDDSWVGFPIKLGDETIRDPAQLSTILERRWHLHLLESERESRVARAQMQSTFRDQLWALEEANLGRPGEAWLWESAHARTSYELRLLDQRLSQLRRREWPLVAETQRRPASHRADLIGFVAAGLPKLMQDDRRILAMIVQTRQRIAGLVLVAEGSNNVSELERAKLELALYQAEWRVWQEAHEEQVLRDQVAQSLASPDPLLTRNVSSIAATAGGSKCAMDTEIEPELVTWFRARAKNKGKQELANCRSKLLEWKLARLRSLRELGYATWIEVAASERDLAQARAQALAAREEQRIAEMEYQRVLSVTDRDASEGRVATLMYSSNP